MTVRLLTLPQKEALEGEIYTVSHFFNPKLDCDNNWVIDDVEAVENINIRMNWVKDLPIIQWCPPTE